MMKDIKVLGTGCSKCKSTVALIEKVAADKQVEIILEKIEDPAKIMTYAVMSTPAVVVDGKVVHKGGVPSADDVAAWL